MKKLFAIRIVRSQAARRAWLMFCLAVAGPLVSLSSLGQDIPVADRKLIEIIVKGSKRFPSADIAGASGLMLGTIVEQEIFRKAARQLGETGAFNDVTFNFSYSSAGTKLTFQVADADKFVPAHFMDFVWFSDQELLQKIHERIPLFNGEVPTSGRLADQVSDVLQALLVERAIPGHVDYVRSESKGGHLESFDYGVADVSLRIDRVGFTGAAPAELAQLKAAAEKLESREFSHLLLTIFINRTILPIYRGHGYLKAACVAQQPKVINPERSETADERREITHLEVTFSITPGAPYKVSGWNWSGNKAFPADALQALIHAQAGQPANTIKLEDNLRAVQQLYGSHGYVTAAIKADAEFDDTTQSVAYNLIVTEGALYHMGDLEFRGIDNGLTTKLRAAWKLRPGDVYDASYLQEFLPQARKLLPATIDWEVDPHITAIAKDRTVDVDLQYTAKATQ